MMRRRWMRWGAVGAVAAVALTGCAGGDGPAPSATPTTPPELSTADAAALAREVYDAYLAEVGEMYVSGDDDYTRLLDWATTEMATLESAGIADLVANGISVSQWYVVDAFEVDEVDDDTVAIAACVNVDDVRLTDSGGTDVTPTDREPFVALSLRFERGSTESLLLDAQDPWDPSRGTSPCGG